MTIAQSLSWPTEPVAYGPVVLRQFSAADLPMVREMSDDPYLPQIGTLPPNASAQEARAYIDRQRGRLAEGKGFSFAIAEADSGRGVGQIGLWLADLDQGRATAGLLRHASRPRPRPGGGRAEGADLIRLDHPGVASHRALHRAVERGSVKTAERAGFDREGLLRSHQEIGGRRRDMLLYAMIREGRPAR